MKKKLFLLGVLVVAFLAHILTQYRLFSLFQATVSIPLLLMLVSPFPVFLAASVFILLELFSSLPQGSMLLMFVIPYVVLFFWKSLHVDISWKFFFGVTLIVALQTVSLIGIVALASTSNPMQFPWYVLLAQILITSFGTFLLAFIYHEYSERL